MLKNHLTIAFRNIARNKFFTFIHVLGLSIGISASLVIFLIVKYELSFDKFESDRERIYRVVMDFKFNGDVGHGAAIPAALPDAIRTEISGVQANVPIMTFQGDASVDVSAIRTPKPEVFKRQTDVMFTVNDYFQLIPFQWIVGSSRNALSKPFSVVLAASRARQYFPGVDLVDIPGRRLVYNGNIEVEVSGIVEDLTEATDFTGKELISYSTIYETSLRNDFMMGRWDDWMAYSKAWVKLNEANDKAGVERQLNDLLAKYHPNRNGDTNNSAAFALQPLSDVHFNTDYASFGQRTANASTLYSLLIIAAFLVLLGCINFVNLSTAQASHRAKEIGIRKTIGSTRKQLIVQFLCETLAIAFLATLVSLGVAPMLMELFSDFIPVGIVFDVIRDPSVLIIPAALFIVVGILSGFYPALVLSRFRPVVVLKNRAFAGSPTRNAGIRKILTVSQFAVAQFFIIAAFMISKQIHFSLNRDLGYRKDAVINFELPRDTVTSHIDRLKNVVTATPGVQMVSTGFVPPAMEGGAYANIKFNNGKEEVSPSVQIRWGDPEFIELYKIGIVAGRNIREGKNVSEALINETYARELGFQDPHDALQKELIQGNGTRLTVVGVMRDFHEGSLHRSIGSIILKSSTNDRFFHVALDPARNSEWQSIIASIENAYHSIYPETDFNYKFFDDTIAAFYKREQDTSKLLNWAMGLSILISALGLLGLVIYISEARTKEIGIRKILGASVSNLVFILSREFILLVMISFAIAAPVAWYAINRWLQSFQYKTEVSMWVFAVSGLALLFIAIATLGAQTIRTATSNPVKSLRNE
jgi:ABC-type antimicrobial peptide transport system permease subunit